MIAIVGGKGGCGKTTTALGIARALATADVPVRAVDLDSGMPNLHRMAGVEREPTLPTVARTAADPQIDRYGVQIVPAPRATTDADVPRLLDELCETAPAARATTSPGHSAHDRPRSRTPPAPTLFDCPAGAGPAAVTPLRAADAAILVTTDRRPSRTDAAKTARAARELDTTLLGTVVTRTDGLSRATARELPTSRAVPVPEATPPLRNTDVQSAYDTVAEWVLEWQEHGARPRDADRVPAAPTDAVARPSRRPRDRRSRRSRGTAGTRSCSRGSATRSGPR